VILNWNGRKYLEQFLPSVLQTAYGNYRVIVADNGSTDDSLSYLQASFPQVELLPLGRNHGFAEGYNLALHSVEADYFMLLNSDVEVTPGWLQPLVDWLTAHAHTAACQPRILSYHKKDFFEYAGAAGGFIDAYGYPFARGRIFDTCERDTGQYNSAARIFWASGAAMLVRAGVFRELGGFDPYFFAHQEEIDLCWRMQLRGWELYCLPASVVYHVGGGTLPRGNSRKTFLNYRNNQVMLAKNLSWKEKWWKIPFRMGLDQVAALRELLRGDAGYFRAVVKAHLAFLGWLFSGKKGSGAPRRKLKKLGGVYGGNIVWDYFVKGRRHFSDLPKWKRS